jgi:hypothetical protein
LPKKKEEKGIKDSNEVKLALIILEKLGKKGSK